MIPLLIFLKMLRIGAIGRSLPMFAAIWRGV